MTDRHELRRFLWLVGDDNSQWQPNLFRNTFMVHRWRMTRLDSFFVYAGFA